ncbi:hypothetical protein Sjap_021925 [Stephania japonica]|uniref:Uncharacterized protein n=1 Tax=Stephania japonica TaxID=461633 RepID=A0AAP0EV35_9MAGN
MDLPMKWSSSVEPSIVANLQAGDEDHVRESGGEGFKREENSKVVRRKQRVVED